MTGPGTPAIVVPVWSTMAHRIEALATGQTEARQASLNNRKLVFQLPCGTSKSETEPVRTWSDHSGASQSIQSGRAYLGLRAFATGQAAVGLGTAPCASACSCSEGSRLRSLVRLW